MPLLLTCDQLEKSFHQRTLFAGITLGIHDSERIGLIGPNGAGKSTLLRILAGHEPHDAGQLIRRRDLRPGYVAQEDQFAPDATPRSVLLAALEADGVHDPERSTRTAIMLTKMAFARPDQLAAELSGGWRKRLAMARELVREPNLLLLDEPTNHLDLEGILWLEKLLESASFACIVVSHDRYLLENMTTRIVEINRAFPNGFYSVPGKYSEFLERREEFLAGQAREQESLANKVRREVAWLKRGPKAQRTKNKSRITDALEMINDLGDLKSRNSAGDAAVKIEFSATERKTNKLLVAHNLAKTLGGRLLFGNVNLMLTPGMRLGVLGSNGSGKSTLLRILAGELATDTGNIKRAPDLRTVYFDQARATVQRDLTLREALSPKADSVVYQGQVVHVNTWAKRFLFRYDQLTLPVSALSGGEQARVLVARLMLEAADVLVLDEPTNDLDIPSLEVLEDSLEEFPGAVVVVTHDRFMLDRMCTELLGLDGEGHANIYTDLTQWQRAEETRRAKAREAARAAESAAKPVPVAKEAVSKRKLTWKEERELEGMEERILAAERASEKLHKDMEVALADPRKLEAVCRELHDAQTLVQSLYARWQELEAKRDA